MRNSLFRKESAAAISILLFMVTAGVFLPSLGHDFVNFDDDLYTYKNSMVQQGLTWAGVRWAFTTIDIDFWDPFTWLSYMFDHLVFGLRAWGYHLTSLGLHAANTVLLFSLMRRMTGAIWRSALVAALFGLHPLHVETVAWIADRKDALSTFFALLSLLAYAAYAAGKPKSEGRNPKSETNPKAEKRNPKPEVRAPGFSSSRFQLPSSIFYVLAFLLFAFGLMSKATVVILPLLLLLLDYWPLGRLSFPLRQPSGTPPLRLVLEKLPFLALGLAVGLATIHAGRHLGAIFTAAQFSFGARLHNALLSLVAYLGQTVWPAKLAVFYPYPRTFPLWPAVGAGALLAGITGLVLSLWRQRPYLIVGWLWFGITLVPTLGLIQLNAIARADRYAYFALTGLLIMTVWGLDELARRWRWPKASVALAAGVALAACVLVSAHQLVCWRNSETLFVHALAVTRDNHIAHDNLGLYLWEHGRTQEAIEHYRASLALYERFEPLHNLALALASQGQFSNAIPLYQAALELRPRESAARKNFAAALAQSGRLGEAVVQYRLALQESPGDLEAQNNLGICLARLGQLDEASALFRKILDTDPANRSAHGNLGSVFVRQKRLAEAAAEFRAVLGLAPNDLPARVALGHAAAELGRLDEAVEQFSTALHQTPNDPRLHFELGLVFERTGQRQEAAAQYRETLRQDPDHAEARAHLNALASGP
jgi:tetratricopeptide (TPR) repeat protein